MLAHEKLDEFWSEKAETILGEKDNERGGLIENLADLVKHEKDLVMPENDNFILLKFLRAGLMNPKSGLVVMKNYYKLRKDYPQYFEKSLQINWMESNILSSHIHCVLPKRDKNGRHVFVFRPGRWDPSKVPFIDIFCGIYLMSELMVMDYKTQIAGIVTIVDAAGFGFKHLRAIGLEDGRNMVRFFDYIFPLWFRQTHILNAPRLFNVFYGMLQPLLSEDVKKEVVFHSGDLTSMRSMLGEGILPSDVGGEENMDPLDNSQNVEDLRSMKDYFKTQFDYGYKS